MKILNELIVCFAAFLVVFAFAHAQDISDKKPVFAGYPYVYCTYNNYSTGNIYTRRVSVNPCFYVIHANYTNQFLQMAHARSASIRIKLAEKEELHCRST
ncbi:MAG: hypothetical protein FWB87_04330 [Defluviitaleaceae bacterium]|nr:hypothetical protein [Defluviitaleaceae bacterium]